MTESSESFEERMQRLGRATEGILPSADFQRRVLGALRAEREPSWIEEAWRGSRRLWPVALVVALGAVFWVVRSENALDDALVASYSTAELEW